VTGSSQDDAGSASPQDRFEHVEVTSAAELHAWLQEHCTQQGAVWLVTWKKAVPDRYVPHEEVLDELVAFGWTDGIRRRVDDVRTRQLVSPRRTQPWARSYRLRAERLVEQGRMQPAGQRSVDQARATGMWDAMEDVDDLVVPGDLAAALAARPPAAEHFAGFPPSTRRNVLRWIASARTDGTRAKRIALTVAEAEHGRRVKSNG
jgi:uncharacterized protein YdeI (YjbR/CyaY-like superfamily)